MAGLSPAEFVSALGRSYGVAGIFTFSLFHLFTAPTAYAVAALAVSRSAVDWIMV
jgi:hypothetical protein